MYPVGHDVIDGFDIGVGGGLISKGGGLMDHILDGPQPLLTIDQKRGPGVLIEVVAHIILPR